MGPNRSLDRRLIHEAREGQEGKRLRDKARRGEAGRGMSPPHDPNPCADLQPLANLIPQVAHGWKGLPRTLTPGHGLATTGVLRL